MKKILLIFLLLLITGCVNKTKLEDRIGKSNELNDKFQVEVTIDKINIRKDASTKSDIIGKVIKGNIYTVNDYIVTNNYIWFKIKTNNNIEGYIASDKKSPYVKYLNGNVDIEGPKIVKKQNKIEIENRNELNEDKIKEVLDITDDSDNFKINYEVNYDKSNNGRMFPVTITATDESNNSTSIEINLNLTGEKKLKSGEWVLYKDYSKVINSFKKACLKYGKFEGISCYNELNWDFFFKSGDFEIRLDSNRNEFCEYNAFKDFEPAGCISYGSNVKYDLLKDKFKNKEEKFLKQIREIVSIFNNDGYDLKDLEW